MSSSNLAAEDPLIGSRIDGRYTVYGVLGQGGMGVVYDGVHDELGRPVAIKVLNAVWATDRSAVERFLREARTASSFSHSNIVDVSDLGRLSDGRPYLVMPKVVGVDLATLLTDSGPQPAKRVADMLVGVAGALDLVHAKGYVHRDIKPENLMFVVREDGTETVMLLDFGIAAAAMSSGPRLTRQGAIFGTPQYLPPEVCAGGRADARGDIYSLAAVAFELITGALLFPIDDIMQLMAAKVAKDAPTLSQATGTLFPPEVEAVIARGLARSPGQRYPTAGSFVKALREVTKYEPVSWRAGVLRDATHSDEHEVGPADDDLPMSWGGPTVQASWPQPQGYPSKQLRGYSEPPPPPPPRRSYADSPRRSYAVDPSGGYSDGSHSGHPNHQGQPATGYYPQPQRHSPAPPGPPWAYGQQGYQTPSRGNYRPSGGYPQTGYGPRANAYAPSDNAGIDPRLQVDENYRSGYGRQVQPRTPWGWYAAVTLAGGLLVFAALQWATQPSYPRGNRPAATRQVKNPPQALPSQTQAVPPATAAPTTPTPTAPQPNAASQSQVPAQQPSAQASQPAAGSKPSPSPSAHATSAPTPNTPSANAAATAGANGDSAASGAGSTDAVSAVKTSVSPEAVSSASEGDAKASPLVTGPKHTAGRNQRFPVDPPAPPEPDYENDSAAVAAPSPVATSPVNDSPPMVIKPVQPVETAAGLTRKSSDALLRGEVGKAVDYARQATNLDSAYALGWRTLGLALERAGSRSSAVAAYEQYLQRVPQGAEADMVRQRMQSLSD